MVPNINYKRKEKKKKVLKEKKFFFRFHYCEIKGIIGYCLQQATTK